ncbi:transposase [Lewinella sp. IMCC34183]|uniref:transposase n=1 Tax=Lewinella sp. IMCC34183 TaxID=2248762 RepID=UPI0013001C8D|nr:transposase [Lewinella sp. IMCC34183]
MTDRQGDQGNPFLLIQRQRKDSLRGVFDAVRRLTRTEGQWRNLNRKFPPWKVVDYRFN